ncbi:MAG: OadG family protein [Candidatus Hodarchaeota archaeon]
MSAFVENLILGIKIAALAMSMTFTAIILIILSTKLLMKLSQEKELPENQFNRHIPTPTVAHSAEVPEIHIALIASAVAEFLDLSQPQLVTHSDQQGVSPKDSLNPWKYSTRAKMMRGRHGR